MSQQRTAEVTEAEIAVHWQEEAHIHPPKEAKPSSTSRIKNSTCA